MLGGGPFARAVAHHAPMTRSVRLFFGHTLVVVLAVSSTGCMGSMRFSSPAPRGHGRIGLVPELAAGHAYDRSIGPQPGGSVEYRRGLSDALDVGGRVFLVGAAVDARHVLTRADTVETSFGLGGRVGASTFTSDPWVGYEIAVEPALRLGVNVSQASQLAFALVPALVYSRNQVAGAADIVKKGVSFAPELVVAFDVGLSDAVHIVPLVGATSFVGSDSFHFTDDTARLRAALGFYF